MDLTFPIDFMSMAIATTAFSGSSVQKIAEKSPRGAPSQGITRFRKWEHHETSGVHQDGTSKTNRKLVSSPKSFRITRLYAPI